MNSLKKLEELFLQGRITRREFLSRAAALGMAAALGPMAFSTNAGAAAPKKGGRFRLGMAGGSTGDTLDPATWVDNTPALMNLQMRNCLVELDHDAQAVPELAESWEPSPDAKTWTFNLRKSVEFHNGKTMDAQDVIFSINIHRGENSKSVAKTYFKSVKNIQADGKHRLIFHLDSGNADFPYLLADIHTTIVPDGTTDFSDGMGTGGYILESFEPGVRSFAKRNPNYFKEGRAHFDEIEVICMADVNSRTTALRTGTIDAMNRCDTKTVNLLKRVPEVQVIQVTGAKHYPFPMRSDTPPYDNNDVRLALKYAVDREQMVKLILRGFGSPGNDTPIGPTYRFHNTELPQRAYDPDKARFHLKKAGLSDHTFKIHASEAAFPGAVDAAVLYQDSAAKAGIKIEVVREPKDGYWSDVWMRKPWCQSYYSGYATEDWMLSAAYAEDSSWNESFWKNDRFNKLLVDARAELDNAKRRDMYWEMQKILWEEGGTVIPMFTDFLDAASKKVKFGPLSKSFNLDGLRCCERWWFDT